LTARSTRDLESEPGPRPVAEPDRSELIRVFVHPLAIDAQHAGEVSSVDEVVRVPLVQQLEDALGDLLRDSGGYGCGDCADVLVTQTDGSARVN
jgi:hypothetical protein